MNGCTLIRRVVGLCCLGVRLGELWRGFRRRVQLSCPVGPERSKKDVITEYMPSFVRVMSHIAK